MRTMTSSGSDSIPAVGGGFCSSSSSCWFDGGDPPGPEAAAASASVFLRFGDDRGEDIVACDRSLSVWGKKVRGAIYETNDPYPVRALIGWFCWFLFVGFVRIPSPQKPNFHHALPRSVSPPPLSPRSKHFGLVARETVPPEFVHRILRIDGCHQPYRNLQSPPYIIIIEYGSSLDIYPRSLLEIHKLLTTIY